MLIPVIVRRLAGAALAAAFAFACLAVSPALAAPEAAAAVSIRDGLAPETDFRPIDFADTFARQTLVYAPGIRLTSKPDNRISRKLGQAGKTGDVGSILWRMTFTNLSFTEGWCWRDPSAAKTGVFITSFFCFKDNDNDGKLEEVFEVPEQGRSRLVGYAPPIPRKASPVSYERIETPGSPDEDLFLVYTGVDNALIGPDDRLIAGRITFNVVAGQFLNPVIVSRRTVDIRPGQKTRFSTFLGHEIEIDHVTAEGIVWLRVVKAPPAGPIDIFGPI